MKLVYDDRAELRRRLVVCDGEAGMEASESNDFAIQLCDDDSVRAARREALQPPANVVRRGRVSKLPNQGCESSCVTRTRIADCDLHRCEECRKQTLRRPGAHGTRYPRCVRQHAGSDASQAGPVDDSGRASFDATLGVVGRCSV
jgi:hypothetical protein